MRTENLLSREDAIATLALLATRHIHRLGDAVEARYRDGSYSRAFPEKARYERATVRLGRALEALAQTQPA